MNQITWKISQDRFTVEAIFLIMAIRSINDYFKYKIQIKNVRLLGPSPHFMLESKMSPRLMRGFLEKEIDNIYEKNENLIPEESDIATDVFHEYLFDDVAGSYMDADTIAKRFRVPLDPIRQQLDYQRAKAEMPLQQLADKYNIDSMFVEECEEAGTDKATIADHLGVSVDILQDYLNERNKHEKPDFYFKTAKSGSQGSSHFYKVQRVLTTIRRAKKNDRRRRNEIQSEKK